MVVESPVGSTLLVLEVLLLYAKFGDSLLLREFLLGWCSLELPGMIGSSLLPSWTALT